MCNTSFHLKTFMETQKAKKIIISKPESADEVDTKADNSDVSTHPQEESAPHTGGPGFKSWRLLKKCLDVDAHQDPQIVP